MLYNFLLIIWEGIISRNLDSTVWILKIRIIHSYTEGGTSVTNSNGFRKIQHVMFDFFVFNILVFIPWIFRWPKWVIRWWWRQRCARIWVDGGGRESLWFRRNVCPPNRVLFSLFFGTDQTASLNSIIQICKIRLGNSLFQIGNEFLNLRFYGLKNKP